MLDQAGGPDGVGVGGHRPSRRSIRLVTRVRSHDTNQADELNGTVALVTGASSGIGEATALALAAQGAAVAIAARRKDRLDELAGRIERAGGTAVAIEADITSQEQAAELVERTVAELGRLDTLVNNAGVMLLGPAVEAPLEEWEQMVPSTSRACCYCAHASLPHLLPPRRTNRAGSPTW